MSEKLKGGDALASLAAYLTTIVVDVPMGDEVVEVEFMVPVGEAAVDLQRELLGLKGDDDEAPEDVTVRTWGALARWACTLMVRDTERVDDAAAERIMRVIGIKGGLQLLADCAGLAARADDLSPDR